jgi:hypothetical protein
MKAPSLRDDVARAWAVHADRQKDALQVRAS